VGEAFSAKVDDEAYLESSGFHVGECLRDMNVGDSADGHAYAMSAP